MTTEFEADEDAYVIARGDAAGTFRLGVSTILSSATQRALDRLIVRGWIRLIDLKPMERGTADGMVRVFQTTTEARGWLTKRASASARKAKVE